jgi:hypothetical protein
VPANFQHDNITAGCASCHNGVDSVGKPASHITTTNVCEDCHTVVRFAPVARVDHTQVLGACSGCHNNSTAPGKPANHIASGNNCESCHTTIGWVPANFQHDNITGN